MRKFLSALEEGRTYSDAVVRLHTLINDMFSEYAKEELRKLTKAGINFSARQFQMIETT